MTLVAPGGTMYIPGQLAMYPLICIHILLNKIRIGQRCSHNQEKFKVTCSELLINGNFVPKQNLILELNMHNMMRSILIGGLLPKTERQLLQNL